MAMNPLFTGDGVGYDPTIPDTTGSEYIVRGEVGLEKLGPAKGFDLWP